MICVVPKIKIISLPKETEGDRRSSDGRVDLVINHNDDKEDDDKEDDNKENNNY